MIVVCAVATGLSVLLLLRPDGLHRLRTAERTTRSTPPPRQVVALAVPVLGLVVLGPLGAAVGLALVPFVWAGLARLEPAAVRRRRVAAARRLPLALDLTVAVLDAGRPPAMAVAAVAPTVGGPLGEDLAQLADRLAVSADPRSVWSSVGPGEPLAPLARAFERAEATGMPVARLVQQLATDRRRARIAERREAARRVGVQTAAPLGLCFLPAFVLIGIAPTVLGVLGGLDLLAR